MIIYKTINLVNDKIYVGKDAANNPKYLGSGIILEKAIEKYGINNFKKEILEECNSLEELNKKEIFWIKKLNSTDRKIGYNISLGGDGGDTFSNLPKELKDKRIKQLSNTSIKNWKNPLCRKKQKQSLIKMWKNSNHRRNIKEKLTGRKITWKDKISKSIKNWHKTDPIPKSSRKRAAEMCRQKFTGRELKKISKRIENKIVKLYQTIGPRLIEKEIGISQYLIVRLLKKKNIYQKWQKGIGEKSQKNASVSRRGKGNPMYKGEA